VVAGVIAGAAAAGCAVMRSATAAVAATTVEAATTTAAVKTAASATTMATATVLGECRGRDDHERERRANYEKGFPKGGSHLYYLQPAEPQGGWIDLKRILHHLTREGCVRLQVRNLPVFSASAG
jgi:hypothetical protein